jgi:hypothetical protein
MNCHQFTKSISRRDMLRSCAGGFGSFALSALAGKEALAAAPGNGPVPTPHLPARAKRVIFLFMWGGPSHMDMFDPKPTLNQEAGKPLSGKSVGIQKDDLGQLIGSPITFRQHGQGGIWMNDLLPHLSRHADKMCVIRSMHTEGNAHGEALLRLHTGQANLVRPSVGSWVSYGLGRQNENLPAFITISPPRGHGGVQNYGNSFLPANHQGMAIGSAEIPIAEAAISNLGNSRITSANQRDQLQLIQSLNERHLGSVGQDPRIEGIISNYELAFRMQSTMPAVMDLSDETSQTLEQYGIGTEPTDNFGRQCLLARKFAERGVRYIQVSTNYTWDHHKKVKEGTIEECAKVDKPIAGLLYDLAQRGLLEDTLVLWGGEFGRTPMVENGDGRNHHPNAFTMWMAGGGVRGGLTYGSTDDFGYAPVDKPVHMHDLHATLLHILGLDHTRLTYPYAGRDFRLTDVYGKVVHDILA